MCGSNLVACRILLLAVGGLAAAGCPTHPSPSETTSSAAIGAEAETSPPPQARPRPAASSAEATSPASERSRPTGGDASAETEGSAVVAEFVRRFNAGEIGALAERFAARADWRLFAWSAKLGRLETVAPDRAEAFVTERFAEIEESESTNPFREPWEALRSGADEAGLQLILVRATELAERGGPTVPALVFGVRQSEGDEELVFATVFGELVEDVSFRGITAVIEEGVGVDPERARRRD